MLPGCGFAGLLLGLREPGIRRSRLLGLSLDGIGERLVGLGERVGGLLLSRPRRILFLLHPLLGLGRRLRRTRQR